MLNQTHFKALGAGRPDCKKSSASISHLTVVNAQLSCWEGDYYTKEMICFLHRRIKMLTSLKNTFFSHLFRKKLKEEDRSGLKEEIL